MKEMVIREKKNAFGDGKLIKIDAKNATINLKKCRFDDKQDIYFLDGESSHYALISQNFMDKIITQIQNLQEKCFLLELEKEIAFSMPIDFEDVMSLAKKIVNEKLESQPISGLDAKNIIKDIKKKHPNLFININKLDKVKSTLL